MQDGTVDRCTCRTCARHARIQAVADSGDVAAMRALILELEETLDHCEMDYQADEAVLAGTWPSAREQLLAALAKCPAEGAA